jgi:hypothetical protein
MILWEQKRTPTELISNTSPGQCFMECAQFSHHQMLQDTMAKIQSHKSKWIKAMERGPQRKKSSVGWLMVQISPFN